MKKRCTNSSCRKVFRVETHTCPYCGKQYPRVNPVNDRYMVVLTYVGLNRLSVIKVIRSITLLNLRAAKTLTDHTPSLVDTGFTRSMAEALKSDFRAAGGDAMIIPVSRGTHGIFVLPKEERVLGNTYPLGWPRI